jgi:transposase-like protein
MPWSDEVKTHVLHDIFENGLNARQAYEKHGVPPSTMWHWIEAAKRAGRRRSPARDDGIDEALCKLEEALSEVDRWRLILRERVDRRSHRGPASPRAGD